jgi:hypothetical protein
MARASARPKASNAQEEIMTNASLRARSLQFALLALCATIAIATPRAARAATHPPMLASDTGWQGELVNRPTCGSGDYDTRHACEAGRH